MKRLADLTAYRGNLPYASELFGIYQPLLGWKSKRVESRIKAAGDRQRALLVASLLDRFAPVVERAVPKGGGDPVSHPATAVPRSARSGGNGVIATVARALPPREAYTPAIWDEILTEEKLTAALRSQAAADGAAPTAGPGAKLPGRRRRDGRVAQLEDQSVKSAMLLMLKTSGRVDILEKMFYDTPDKIERLLEHLKVVYDPFALIDPTSQLDRVGLSPVGIAHLFRQYFFELDTFLGTPVGHVWLAPGASAELVEVHTRRELVERTVEQSQESLHRAESESLQQDELSDAVKQENQTNLKLGVNVSATQSWGWGSANESASFGYDTTQSNAREQTHKSMRQQSEKLTTEMKRSFKTTFRTVTETTDISSKRYVLMNSTDKLLNYELRRKMRQVAVQVQDIGSFLCWQTYVDEPGRSLGLGRLVHIGAPPEVNNVPPPEVIEPPHAIVTKEPLTFPFIPAGDGDASNDEAFREGVEVDDDDVGDQTNHIEWKFKRGPVRCEQAGYKLSKVAIDPAGASAQISVHDIAEDDEDPDAYWYVAHLDLVDFKEQREIAVQATFHWEPKETLAAEIETKNKERLDLYTAQSRVQFQRAFLEAARERIKLASELERRPVEDLREEERTVVYRALIQDMLAPEKYIPQPDSQTHHIVAELINSIFDVEKLLYFVAPEWWRPREHYGQELGGIVEEVDPATGEKIVVTNDIPSTNQYAWGDSPREDDYYLTDESKPAPLGSSLGWLLQLDGDDMRNAFLNAPWVKAVMPIRPGREKAALNWLKHVEGMNGIEADDMYQGPEPEWRGKKTVFEVLEILAGRVAAKNAASTETQPYTDPMDTESTVSATPIDRVYEHGFDPLADGFRAHPEEDFEVFDQWMEVLPTDQVVAVEVTYDPKTGRQL